MMRETFAGVIKVYRVLDDGDCFGYIAPEIGPDVWFGSRGAQGETFAMGDKVSFTYDAKPKFADKPAAFRVYLENRRSDEMAKQPIVEGTVIHSALAEDTDRPWGKIRPSDGSALVWYGVDAASPQGQLFERGDHVEFIYDDAPKHPDKPAAYRVYLKRKAIN
jgi:hypothetical protein